MNLPNRIIGASVVNTVRIIVTTCSRTLVAQVAVLVDVKAMLLSRSAVKTPQFHRYRYVVFHLHPHANMSRA